MINHVRAKKNRCLAVLAATLSFPVILNGCATPIGQAITALGMAFGQDLMASASVNYTPRYAMQMEVLLNAMATTLTGVQMQPQLARYGYQPPPPKYMRKQQEEQQQAGYGGGGYGGYSSDPYGNDPYASNDPYSQQGYGQGAYGQQADPYAQQGQYPQQDPYAQQGQYPQQDPYAQQGQYPQQDPYAQQQDPYAQQQDPYAQQQDPYAQQQDPYAQQNPYAQSDPYASQAGPYRSASSAPPAISLNAALFVQRAGSNVLEQVKDGDVLNDGRGNPAAGDLLKVHFSSNCACYVYVVGIDATGYVAQIYPDPDAQHTNPVQPGREYRLPEGDDWWGLDEYRGVEQVYFIAGRERNSALEGALADMAAQPRTRQLEGYRAVQEPAIIRTTRGLVKVSLAQPVDVQAPAGTEQQIPPTNYLLDASANGMVITRWFEHR